MVKSTYSIIFLKYSFL